MAECKNLMEVTVDGLMKQVLPSMTNVCQCDECRLEMKAYALNRLPPKYVTSNKGEIYYKFDVASSQVEAEIISVVINAIQTIGAHPNHPV